MARSLVIVESPAKAKTINKYLGRGYTVKASYGHVMDLPKKTIGILLPGQPDGKPKRKTKKGKGKAKAGKAPEKPEKKIPITSENIFEPTYEIIPDKQKIIGQLRSAADSADNVYLATDPDREGEAISAHLLDVLAKNKADRAKFSRVMFNEITQKAIRAAFEKPTKVDEHLVDAQQARRVLDRIVGYKVSPLLWDKVRRGLSAGRVQTVALRLIVEREQEIRAFNPKEYWSIHALLAAGEPPSFEAKLVKRKGEDLEIPDEAESQRILSDLERATWTVSSVAQKEKRRFAPPPFTTSKLQQAAYNRLRFTAKRTMMLAQKLYEGIDLGSEGSIGLITYMRTDSVHVSADALSQVRDHIGQRFGAKYVPEKPNFFKSKKDAQEAHEAIRPTDVARTPESVRAYLDEPMFKLYQMIWQRFVASQMVPAVFDQTTIEIAAGDYLFRVSGSVEKFNGYLAAYQSVKEDDEDKEEGDSESRALPAVREGQELRLESIRPEQHFTEPPPRYTEATLVKELEEKGIGRPSTYAAIISTLVDREYVTKDQGRFTPTLLGERVSVLLVKSFEDIFDVNFTARMEEELDEVEEGKLPWRDSVKGFWDRFEEDLERASDKMASYKAGIPTGQKCEKCEQGELLERISRHGFFLGCSRYPECDFIRDIAEVHSDDSDATTTTQYCDNCGKEMVIKRGRFGAFLACTGYPDCKTTRRLVSGTKVPRQPDVPLDENCPDCGAQLLRRQGRYGDFIGCKNYPKCKYTRPVTMGIKCPKCGEGEFVRRGTSKGRGRGRIFYGCSRYPDCDFTTPHEPINEPCPKCGAPFVVEKRTKHGNYRACIKEGCDWEVEAPEAPPAEANPVTSAPSTSPAPSSGNGAGAAHEHEEPVGAHSKP
ncbi:MAG TPA: type I DNA topoisomerase [Candidatus Dormibacteraeota bacterium]|nr:type I DNA topoisomerase [Candidatus Dormibacteraeota bacterium]